MEKQIRRCQNCKGSFEIDAPDFDFYEKIKVPPPTWCPECRLIRRLVFKNQRLLFRKKDEATGKEIFSAFPRAAPVKIYNHDYWWQDGWDSLQYGREYDFSRTFFDQFRELLLQVPLPARSVINVINSDYCDYVGDIKNGYFCFDGIKIENTAYAVASSCLKESFDIYDSGDNELCYEGALNDNCYRVFFSFDCEDCRETWFSKDLTGCSNCFGCVNLRNKSYCIFNQSYSREVYLDKLKEFDLGSFLVKWDFLEKAHLFWGKFPVKYMHGTNNINSNGEHLQDTRKVVQSYSVHKGENLKYVQSIEEHATDCYDYTIGGNNSVLMYECVSSEHQCAGLKFSWDCWPDCRDLEYSAFCRSSSNLFGCVGLKKKQYCILNKQYGREDYFTLREKIIKQMDEMPYGDIQGRVYKYGEFFPPEFSPFAYNETYTSDFFPMSTEAVAKAGYLWRESEAREYQTTISARDLPDHIRDTDDSILKEVIQCESCAKAFRIIPMEFDFYKRMILPLPRFCPNCRFQERFKFVNPIKFWHRQCTCAGTGSRNGIYTNQSAHFHQQDPCLNEFETSYAPERPEIVYCESCYQAEVI